MQVNTRPDINALLAEMRSMRQQAQDTALAEQIELAPLARDAADPTGKVEGGGFGDVLRQAIDSVNEVQMEAGRMTDAFVRGEQDDLVGTMIAVQKSSVAFQGATQIRNRLVSAYEDIMNMPI